jgi:hypothetical protein
MTKAPCNNQWKTPVLQVLTHRVEADGHCKVMIEEQTGSGMRFRFLAGASLYFAY